VWGPNLLFGFVPISHSRLDGAGKAAECDVVGQGQRDRQTLSAHFAQPELSPPKMVGSVFE
jgi:hypothetical protein